MMKRDACKRCWARGVALILAAILCGMLELMPLAAHADGETGQTAYVKATHLILRKQAKEKGSPITQLDQDEAVTILGYKDEWVYIGYKKHKGYVKGEFLTMDVPGMDTPAQKNTPAQKSSGSSAKSGDSVLRREDEGEAVHELQQLLAQAGYEVIADGEFGSSTENALILFQRSCGLTADGLAGAQTLSKLRESVQSVGIDTPARASDSALRLEDRGEAVRELQQWLKNAGYSVGTDGVFGERTEKAVIAFQLSAGLTADGLAGKQTLALLRNAKPGSAQTAGTGQVEQLDWWKGGSSAFPVGTKATVVDVRSGIRFTVKRWGGVNHADVEPLTSADTAQMKRAYGGAWSWNRRPIWVLVGNRAIAASMNGMPHMGYSNKTNEFPGHFCIHMKSSRTHGSNRVDEGHANAVSEAYEKRDSL